MSRTGFIAPTFSHAALGIFPLALVLLVFLLVVHFTATIPVFSCGKLALPVVASPQAYLDGGDLVHISMQDDGSVFIESKWYPASELPSALAKAVRRAPPIDGAGIVVSVDSHSPFSSVRRLLRLLADSGVSRVILQVDQIPAHSLLPGT